MEIGCLLVANVFVYGVLLVEVGEPVIGRISTFMPKILVSLLEDLASLIKAFYNSARW